MKRVTHLAAVLLISTLPQPRAIAGEAMPNTTIAVYQGERPGTEDFVVHRFEIEREDAFSGFWSSTIDVYRARRPNAALPALQLVRYTNSCSASAAAARLPAATVCDRISIDAKPSVIKIGLDGLERGASSYLKFLPSPGEANIWRMPARSGVDLRMSLQFQRTSSTLTMDFRASGDVHTIRNRLTLRTSDLQRAGLSDQEAAALVVADGFTDIDDLLVGAFAQLPARLLAETEVELGANDRLRDFVFRPECKGNSSLCWPELRAQTCSELRCKVCAIRPTDRPEGLCLINVFSAQDESLVIPICGTNVCAFGGENGSDFDLGAIEEALQGVAERLRQWNENRKSWDYLTCSDGTQFKREEITESDYRGDADLRVLDNFGDRPRASYDRKHEDIYVAGLYLVNVGCGPQSGSTDTHVTELIEWRIEHDEYPQEPYPGNCRNSMLSYVPTPGGHSFHAGVINGVTCPEASFGVRYDDKVRVDVLVDFEQDISEVFEDNNAVTARNSIKVRCRKASQGGCMQ
jgi:hypothetical protein